MAGLLEINSRAAEKKLEKLAHDAGVTVGFVCEDQMRLWINDIINQAPPPSYAKGRMAVKADLERLFEPIDDPGAIAAWKKASAQRGGDIYTYTKRGKARISAEKLKASNLATMARIHRQNRRKSDGRVYIRWRKRDEAWGGEFLVPSALFKKYVASAQKKVGFLKSRFGKAALHYAARTHGRTPAYKDWIRRLIPGGSFSGRIVFGTGAIEATNDAMFAAKQMVSKAWWMSTKGKRQRDLTRGGFKRMADLTRRFNMG